MRQPTAFAVLGQFRALVWEKGRTVGKVEGAGMLAASADGRVLYRIHPGQPRLEYDGEIVPRELVSVADRRREWQGVDPEILSASLTRFQDPKLLGKVILIRYLMDRGQGVQEWEHYFSSEARPDYPEVFDVGHSQLVIARGRFIADGRGIRFHQ